MPVLPKKVEKVRNQRAWPAKPPSASSTTESCTTAPGPNSAAARSSSVITHLVGKLLELGQLADHGDQLGNVGLDRRADHPVRARFAAETTALRDASRMDESRPTPHQVEPSGPAHST